MLQHRRTQKLAENQLPSLPQDARLKREVGVSGVLIQRVALVYEVAAGGEGGSSGWAQQSDNKESHFIYSWVRP